MKKHDVGRGKMGVLIAWGKLGRLQTEAELATEVEICGGEEKSGK